MLEHQPIHERGKDTRQFVRCPIAAKLSPRLRTRDDILDLGIDTVPGGQKLLDHVGRCRDDLPKCRAGKLLHLLGRCHVGHDDRSKLIAHVGIFSNGFASLAAASRPLLDDRPEDVEFRIEVVVDRALGQSGGKRDVIDPGAVEPARCELGGSGIE